MKIKAKSKDYKNLEKMYKQLIGFCIARTCWIMYNVEVSSMPP